jgi:hypothetical protein
MIGGVCNFLNCAIMKSHEKLISAGKQHLMDETAMSIISLRKASNLLFIQFITYRNYILSLRINENHHQQKMTLLQSHFY